MENLSAPDLLDRLVEREEEERRLSAMNEDFARLREDEAVWSDFKAETAAWDASGAPT